MKKSLTVAQDPATERAQRIEHLTRELMELKREEDAEREALRRSVKPIVQYLITPDLDRRGWNKSFDPEAVFYSIAAHCSNTDEVRAVGGHEPPHGSMTYIFNKATGRLVCYVSGGNIFLADTQEAFDQVSAFLREHPEGGDISDIVTSTRKVR